tara:strand:+ start:1212 stop:1598 length:387 start_codon:yes stop_codon:yes gene_type:complete
MASGISVKLPLQYSPEDGPYQLTKNLAETAKQNFKNLILTIPGEKIMNPDFGVGLHQLLFENATDEIIEELNDRIENQVSKYLPFISLINVDVDFFENNMNLKIEYFVRPLGIGDNLSLEVANFTQLQ